MNNNNLSDFASFNSESLLLNFLCEYLTRPFSFVSDQENIINKRDRIYTPWYTEPMQ